jgi:hypothetical protein
MRRRTAAILCLLVFALTLAPIPTLAQSYSFSVEEYIVDAYWQSDGTLSVQYSIVFNNDTSAPAIEYIDIGMHNKYYDLSRVRASIKPSNLVLDRMPSRLEERVRLSP